MFQTAAFKHCTALNARLPVPKSQAELTEFSKFFPERTWLGLTNPDNKKDLSAWIDTDKNVPDFVKWETTENQPNWDGTAAFWFKGAYWDTADASVQISAVCFQEIIAG